MATLQELDNLTPHYQVYMDRLSPQQRKVVAVLAEFDEEGATPAQLSDASRITQHSQVSAILHRLSKEHKPPYKDYVREAVVKNENRKWKLCDPVLREWLRMRRRGNMGR